MNINRNSWHYRLIMNSWFSFLDNPPRSLCTYFWAVVANLVWVPFVSTIATLSILVLLSFLTAPFEVGYLWYTTGDFGFLWKLNDEGKEILTGRGVRLIIGSITYLVVISMWVHESVILPRRRRKYKQDLEDYRNCQGKYSPDYKEPEPNILWSYLVAIKNKVCPMITYVKE